MKVYTIHRHPLGTLLAVKEGWSWPAFFFTWIWCLVKKLYGVAVFMFFLQLCFSLASTSNRGSVVMAIVAGAITALGGNYLVRLNLGDRGFVTLGKCRAATPEGALAAFATRGCEIIPQNAMVRAISTTSPRMERLRSRGDFLVGGVRRLLLGRNVERDTPADQDR